jgi:enamine deaminase RidA (YjgF/YER057c/UK114 family)
MASDSETSGGRVEHLNPEGLSQNPAFTNVVVVDGPVRTIYIGGQDAVDATGKIVGAGDIGAQSAQVFANIQTALEAAGAGLEHVIKWNILIVQGQPLEPGFAEFQRVWGERPNPPAITAAFVSALANPEFLVEIDAIAVVPL